MQFLNARRFVAMLVLGIALSLIPANPALAEGQITAEYQPVEGAPGKCATPCQVTYRYTDSEPYSNIRWFAWNSDGTYTQYTGSDTVTHTWTKPDRTVMSAYVDTASQGGSGAGYTLDVIDERDAPGTFRLIGPKRVRMVRPGRPIVLAFDISKPKVLLSYADGRTIRRATRAACRGRMAFGAFRRCLAIRPRRPGLVALRGSAWHVDPGMSDHLNTTIRVLRPYCPRGHTRARVAGVICVKRR